MTKVAPKRPYRKRKIPKALREQVWITHMGVDTMRAKCKVTWCKNMITAFDFQCGHNIPESKGGETTLDNLIPICSRCNTSMGAQYSIDQWNRYTNSVESAHVPSSNPFCSCFGLFS